MHSTNYHLNPPPPPQKGSYNTTFAQAPLVADKRKNYLQNTVGQIQGFKWISTTIFY